MIKFIRKNKKTLKKIFYILWWIFYLNIGRTILTGEGWGKDGESAIRGVLLTLYPLTLFHLNSAIKTGDLFYLKKEHEAALTEAQITFFQLTTLVSGLTFIFINAIGVVVSLIWVYMQLSK